MRLRWYGQAAFLLTGDKRVAIDPFVPDHEATRARGIEFNYPPIEADADLLLVTHEHFDHNGVAAIGGDPQVIRSTAGTFDSPVGTVTAIASEHDDVAGTKRGPNTIFAFALGGLRFVHFGDFGQSALRPEQRAVIGDADVLLLPVGGGPTIGAEQAKEIVRELRPRLVVPMHYRTEAINFTDPPDAFLAGFDVTAADGDEIEVEEHLEGQPAVVRLRPPLAAQTAA